MAAEKPASMPSALRAAESVANGLRSASKADTSYLKRGGEGGGGAGVVVVKVLLLVCCLGHLALVALR